MIKTAQMANNESEADARIIIDDLLRKAGWDPADKSQVRTEVSVKRLPSQLQDSAVGSAGEEILRTDYALLSSRGRNLSVVEAKRKAIDPYTAKNQARPAAEALDADFIFLSNGELIYFWDYRNEDARLVHSFFSQRDLERLAQRHRDQKALATIPVPETYLRYGEVRIVRNYQGDCMRAMDHALELGKRRFLIELPTGTGKTDLICLQLKRLLKSIRAERILFLVDREQLAKQAIGAVQDILNHHSSYWLKPGVIRQEKEITVALLQTMMGRYQEYTSGYFDVVIADECHRSIYGAWQAVLNHFDALQIGLTATPAAYIERNTYQFYQCSEGKPDFSYPIRDAFKAGHLAPYKFAEGITEMIAEGAEVDGEIYDPEAFERNWTNEDTNRKMMQEFDRLAWSNYQESAPFQKKGPGKAIVFAITKRHASRLCQYLNELHPEHKGRYAEVITSDIPDADQVIQNFKKEIYPMVAVSVDMLTTGFDCPEVLHIVMCRKIFSPILYQQIRGRGTRTAPHIGKKQFVIYDFFRNHQYFNDDGADITVTGGGGGGGRKPPGPPRELIELGLKDEWLEAVTYVEVGPDGERVDKREYQTRWEQVIRQQLADDPLVKKVREEKPLTSEEEDQLARHLNTPENYFNEDNLRRAYRQPGGNLVDFIRAALGTLKIKTREEQITENFQAWLVSKNFRPEQAEYLVLLKHRGVIRGRVEIGDLFEPPLSIHDAATRGVELFGESGLQSVIADMNESIFALAA
jgi:type I restriction enzyme R subunit